MIRAALLGAILVHPIVFLAAFLMGMMFGANPHFGGGPPTDRVFGWQGGLTGMEELFFIYLITMGLTPLVITIAGTVLALLVCLLNRVLLRNRAAASSDGKPNRPE